MSILNNDDPTDMSEVLESLGTEGSVHNDHEAEATPMSHEQVVALLTQERDYYREESLKDREALKTFVAFCKEKGMNPFADDEAAKLIKAPCEMTREELVARNKEAGVCIARNMHVDSKDKLPMPTYEEQEKLYKENPQVTLFMELMDKSKAAEKERVAKRLPKDLGGR